MNTDFIVVYMTASNAEEALKIARGLVERKLAACVNVLGPIHSVYRWEGKVCEEGEVAFIAKTQQSLFTELCTFVKSVHSYTCPCILALPVVEGSAPYLDWLRAEINPVPGHG